MFKLEILKSSLAQAGCGEICQKFSTFSWYWLEFKDTTLMFSRTPGGRIPSSSADAPLLIIREKERKRETCRERLVAQAKYFIRGEILTDHLLVGKGVRRCGNHFHTADDGMRKMTTSDIQHWNFIHLRH